MNPTPEHFPTHGSQPNKMDNVDVVGPFLLKSREYEAAAVRNGTIIAVFNLGDEEESRRACVRWVDAEYIRDRQPAPEERGIDWWGALSGSEHKNDDEESSP
jgi:hypothetical protein